MRRGEERRGEKKEGRCYGRKVCIHWFNKRSDHPCVKLVKKKNKKVVYVNLNEEMKSQPRPSLVSFRKKREGTRVKE